MFFCQVFFCCWFNCWNTKKNIGREIIVVFSVAFEAMDLGRLLPRCRWCINLGWDSWAPNPAGLAASPGSLAFWAMHPLSFFGKDGGVDESICPIWSVWSSMPMLVVMIIDFKKVAFFLNLNLFNCFNFHTLELFYCGSSEYIPLPKW